MKVAVTLPKFFRDFHICFLFCGVQKKGLPIFPKIKCPQRVYVYLGDHVRRRILVDFSRSPLWVRRRRAPGDLEE
jgi:hypothetical protein